jgi:RimJ/RimL family protein N-acetyltransferase
VVASGKIKEAEGKRMTVPAIPSAGDPRKRLAADLFDHLVRSALDQETEPDRAEARIWRLPGIAAHFVFNPGSDAQREALDPLVHELQRRAVEAINVRLDRAAARQRLSERVAAAASRLTLRSWTPDDAGTYAALLSEPDLWTHLPERSPGPIDAGDAAQLIAATTDAPDRHLVRAAQAEGRVVGQARLQFDSSSYRDSAEISYWIARPEWGRGLATDLVTLFTAQSFAMRPGLDRIFARVLDGHDASLRVLEKAGYRVESYRHRGFARDGEARSVHTLSVWRADYPSSAAADITAPAEERRSVAWAAWAFGLTEALPVLEAIPAVCSMA